MMVCAGIWLGVAAARGSQRSELLVARAEVAYATGRYEEALRLFTAAAEADPTDVAAAYGRGLALSRLGRWEEAEDAFERALALRPGLTSARRAAAHAAMEAGKAALDAGRARDAVPRFERAAELDPAIAQFAHYFAALAHQAAGEPDAAEADFERARRGPDAVVADQATRALEALTGRRVERPWEVWARVGLGYDSNVTVTPAGADPIAGSQGDLAGLLAAGFHWDVIDRPRELLRVAYDLRQTLHPSLGDFDLRWQRVYLLGAHAVRGPVQLGLEGEFDHYTLGSSGFLAELSGGPLVSVAWGNGHVTDLGYRYSWLDYLDPTLDGIRDGYANQVNLIHGIELGAPDRVLTLSWAFEVEDTRSPDFDFVGNQALVGLEWPAWWGTTVEFDYALGYDRYTSPNRFTGFTENRRDLEHLLLAELRRPFGDHVTVGLAYQGTVNGSNVDVFRYRRHVVGTYLEVTF
jgi:hypothetical protein